MELKEIIAGCRRGDRKAQEALFSRTSERVYRLLLRMTRDPDDAFDLAQETYLLAFRRFDQYDGRASVDTWLHRIAVNEALQFFRSRKRKTRLHADAGHRLEQAAGDRTLDPGLQAVDRRLDLDEALESLPDADRELLLLRYRAGLDYAALAEALGKPPGTIASALNRARRLLRERLEERELSDEEPRPGRHPTR